jgi:colanic acid/amylovoran biosynthesis glycosyltransferase
MKLAYVTVQFPYGRYEAFFASEVNELVSLSHDVTVIPSRPQETFIGHRDFSANVLRLPLFGLRTFALAAAEFARHPIAVFRVVKELLFARHQYRAKLKNLAVLPKALAVAWEMRRQGIEHIHALWLSTPATISYVVSELTGIPWSCSAHRFDVFTDNLLREKLSSAQFVRAISENTRNLLVERAGADVGDRCHVLHLGVNVPLRFHTPQRSRSLRLLCPAQLVPKKGHQYLLQALALLNERGVPFHCDLAGDGPLAGELKQSIDELGLSQRVKLCGTMPHDILLSRLERNFYDLVVLSSVDIGDQPGEGIPVSLMEAMAVGVPCVATDTGGVAELIDDPRCSRLVPQRDPAALADAIADFAQHPEQHVDIGQWARRRICDAFDVRATTKSLCALMGAS